MGTMTMVPIAFSDEPLMMLADIRFAPSGAPYAYGLAAFQGAMERWAAEAKVYSHWVENPEVDTKAMVGLEKAVVVNDDRAFKAALRKDLRGMHMAYRNWETRERMSFQVVGNRETLVYLNLLMDDHNGKTYTFVEFDQLPEVSSLLPRVLANHFDIAHYPDSPLSVCRVRGYGYGHAKTYK